MNNGHCHLPLCFSNYYVYIQTLMFTKPVLICCCLETYLPKNLYSSCYICGFNICSKRSFSDRGLFFYCCVDLIKIHNTMIFSSSTDRLKHKQLCVIVHKENHMNKPSQ